MKSLLKEKFYNPNKDTEKQIRALNQIIIGKFKPLFLILSTYTDAKVLKDLKRKVLKENHSKREADLLLRIQKLSVSFVRFFIKSDLDENDVTDCADCYSEWINKEHNANEFTTILNNFNSN